MHLLYFILHVILKYPLRLFYPNQVFINKPKKYFNRTIYVSNHAASFMDPLIIGSLQRPSVFFMTRSDVFTPLSKPILWQAQMLPIYRQHDGEDTKAKNNETFVRTSKVLAGGRSLLIFGEGFTDDVFIRRLKPLKKGAVRMGFDALERCDWKKNVYMATLGINYGDPNVFGSDLVVSNGKPICLNDYKEAYKASSTKTVNELTLLVEKDLQNQLTHVENANWVFFHEHVTRLLREGMHPADSDYSIPLKQRWENSRRLAKWMNEQVLDENINLVKLKEDLENYFNSLKKNKVEEKQIFQLSENKNPLTIQKVLALKIGIPFSMLGFIHGYVPYILVKRFVEKSFKRRVFWSSVKLLLGAASMAVWNIPLVITMHAFIFKPLLADITEHTVLFAWIYYLILPLFGVIAYKSYHFIADAKVLIALKKTKYQPIVAERASLIQRIKTFYS
jgi:hypothetical protein